jgi:L-alanine-DL-glutamate epimerase-like enolase superfamily enzyme
VKIADLEVMRLRSPEYARPLRPAWTPGGSWNRREAVLVRVDTDEGIVGWGAFNGSDVSAVEGWLKPQLIGKDPFGLEQHARLFRNAGGGWGVEIALWDIIGNATGQPV